MGIKDPYERSAWENQYEPPSVPQLRKSLSAIDARLFDRTRKQLLRLEGVTETCAWYGQCWRWTIEYHAPGSDEPLAIIIPSPEDLQMAVPLTEDFTRSLPVKRFKRALRDGLDLGRAPFDTRWGVWSIQTTLLDELKDLVARKHSFLHSAPA